MRARISDFLGFLEDPCPFCGSEDVAYLPMLDIFSCKPMTFCVICAGCKARGPLRENPELAVRDWNHRQG